jgi:tRNA 2-thiouridine synthesizing protein A
MSTNVDARGLSCPQPALLTRQALQTATGGEVTVLVDTMTQVQSCSRAAAALGWEPQYQPKAGGFELRFRKPAV